MDIVRDESVKIRKKRKQILVGIVGVIAILGITLGVSRLKPADPVVESSTIWPDTVKRGSMLRQVREELEHRHLDRYGERRDEMHRVYDTEGDWGKLLQSFAQAAEAQ